MVIDDLPEDVPDGAAVFPLIPPELGIDPLLLAVLHAVVFLIGSSDDVVHSAASEEALQYLVTYMQQLKGARLQRVREDIKTLTDFARQDGWPKQETQFLKSFLKEFGVGEEATS